MRSCDFFISYRFNKLYEYRTTVKLLVNDYSDEYGFLIIKSGLLL